MKLTKAQLKALHDDIVLASQIGDLPTVSKACAKLKLHIESLDDENDSGSNPPSGPGNPTPPGTGGGH